VEGSVLKNRLFEYLANPNAVEGAKILEGNCFYISVTERCNSHCRHCSGREFLSTNADAEESAVLDWIDQIKDTSVKLVYFIGGEPFLLKDKLIRYVKKANEAGLFSGVVTNGSWAKTAEQGIEILQAMEGLNLIVLSSDKYHLEYIDAQTVKNAIEAGLATNKLMAMNITYIEKKEVEEVFAVYKDYKHKIAISSARALPIGGAAGMPVEREPFFQNIERISAACDVGKYMINTFGEVFGCCQTCRIPDSYLSLGKLTEENLSTILQRIPNNFIYEFIRRKGPRGVAEVFMKSPFQQDLVNQLYTGPCDFCMKLLGNPKGLEYFSDQLRVTDAVNQ
jgi:pyruvate-formate lyase-activating enzyme